MHSNWQGNLIKGPTSYVIDGLHQGFQLGFHRTLTLKSATSNKPSARQPPSVMDDYLAGEVSLHHVAGPFASPPALGSLICVNDSINPEEFSLQYIKVDQIILMASKYGSGSLLAKFDVEAAYHNIAVHPDDHFLLGKWRGKYFVDLVLPFGLRSALFIFNSVADMVECIFTCRIISQVCSTTSMTSLQQGLPIPLSVLPICKLPCSFAKN